MRRMVCILLLALSSLYIIAQGNVLGCYIGLHSFHVSENGRNFAYVLGKHWTDAVFDARVGFEYRPVNNTTGDIKLGSSIMWSPIGTFFPYREWEWFDIWLYTGGGIRYASSAKGTPYSFSGVELDISTNNWMIFADYSITGKDINLGVKYYIPVSHHVQRAAPK